jgi:putative transposase
VYLRKLLPTLLKRLPGVSLESIGFDKDHVHLVIVIPPKYAISEVMGILKSQSSSRLRKKFAFLEKYYWAEDKVFWSPGYLVSSVGVSEAAVKNYVERQGRQDSGEKQRKLFL